MSKHILVSIALAATAIFAFSPTSARAASGDDISGSHWYVGVGIGSGESRSTTTTYDYYGYLSTFTGSTDGAALQLALGRRYANRRGDAIGIGLTDTGISLSDSSGAGILGLDLNGKVHIAGGWFISGRVGTYSGRKFVSADDGYYYGSRQDGSFFGAGTGVDINASNALAVSWTRYHVDDFTDDSTYPASYVTNAHLDVFLLSYTYTF